MARVPHVTRDMLRESDRPAYDEMAGGRGVSSLGVGFGALLNSPDAARRISAVGLYLRFKSPLPDVMRELAILAVSAKFRCRYEWLHHEPLARKAGLSEEAIAALKEGREPERLPEEEAVVLRFAQELLDSSRVSDDAFEAVRARLGNQGAVELSMLVGYYSMLALAFGALIEED